MLMDEISMWDAIVGVCRGIIMNDGFFGGGGFRPTTVIMGYGKHTAVGQSQWYHFRVGARWDVRDLDPWPHGLCQK